MKCLNPITVNGNLYNCGHCVNCRVNYTQMWALRLIYELSTTDRACFVTLTYSEDKRPGQLVKKDLQDFFKRLRQNYKREYHEFGEKLRYYAVGEYGSMTKREHYHAIIFGLDNFSDKDRDILRKSWPFCEPWLFDKERGRKSAMQEVTPDDIQYVTGYVQKKLNGQMAKEEYGEKQPPFSLCSQGLGLDFALKNKERLIKNGYTYFKGHKVGIPRYFCQKFGIKKSDLIDFENNNTLEEWQKSGDTLFEYFKEDMQRKNCWYPQNSGLMKRLFEYWYDDRRFALSQRVYEDFKQRQKMRGIL